MEAAGLAVFMISACVFATLLEHPASPIRQTLANPLLRRGLMGTAMGLTAVGIIYSPWGQQSGAHINPAVTLTFLRLGKVEPWDALFYVCAQFVGGTTGVALSALVLGAMLAHPTVNHVVTVPGSFGLGVAFTAEVIIAFILMVVILVTTNSQKLRRYTGLFAGFLVAVYITIEAPVSGMSMNPARTLSSAVIAQVWNAWWLYLLAPPLGMLVGAEVYLRLCGRGCVSCAKLNHVTNRRCIFRCGYASRPHEAG